MGDEKETKGESSTVKEAEGREREQEDEQLKQERALAQANGAKNEGNQLYVAGKFEDALSKYELALYFAPDLSSTLELRSICHSNRAVCFLKQDKYEETIKEATKALELNAKNLKALIRRGEAHENLKHYDESIADMKSILELDPPNDLARGNLRRLEPLAAEKREKMKEEMIGKLKDMGNSFLGRFGLNMDSVVKDPVTGSYSISTRPKT